MFELTKTFCNDTLKIQVTPIMMGGELIFVPQEFEEQLGFSDIAHSIQTSGFIEDRDFLIIRNGKLSSLKELLRSYGTTDRAPQLYERIKLAPSLMVLTESGFYGLLFRSNKEQAVAFRLWVTDTVLPAIRRDGGYKLPAQRSSLDVAYLKTEFAAAIELAKLLKFEGNQAILAAGKLMRKEYGKDYVALLEASLPTEIQELYVTPTELGRRLTTPVSANKINIRLSQFGHQVARHDDKGKQYWELTETGRQFGKYLDTGKAHSDGTPVQQIKWSTRLIGDLNL